MGSSLLSDRGELHFTFQKLSVLLKASQPVLKRYIWLWRYKWGLGLVSSPFFFINMKKKTHKSRHLANLGHLFFHLFCQQTFAIGLWVGVELEYRYQLRSPCPLRKYGFQPPSLHTQCKSKLSARCLQIWERGVSLSRSPLVCPHNELWVLPLSWSPSFMVLIHVRDSACPVFPPEAVTLIRRAHAWKIFLGVRDTGKIHILKERTTINYHLFFLNMSQPCLQHGLPMLSIPFMFIQLLLCAQETTIPALSIYWIGDVQGVWGGRLEVGSSVKDHAPYGGMNRRTLSQP